METNLLGQVFNSIGEKNIEKNDLNNKIENNMENKQNNFLESSLGKVINMGLDIGLRAILPDMIENQLIEVKNALFQGGFKEGLNQMIQSTIDLGKSALGIFTGKFENISQVQNVIKTGGIIDSTSNLIDWSLRKVNEKELLNKTTINLIQQGKNILLSNVGKEIENLFTEQLKSIEKVNKYSIQWKDYYEQKNIEGMEKEYQKIKTEMKKVIPLENTIKEAREIENIQELIKSKGYQFELSKEELELAKKLA